MWNWYRYWFNNNVYRSDIKLKIYSTGFAAAIYLKQINWLKDVYVVGDKGIHDELKNVGIISHGIEDNSKLGEFSDLDLDENIKTVIVGVDEYFNYYKLTKAMNYLRKKDSKLIGLSLYINFF